VLNRREFLQLGALGAVGALGAAAKSGTRPVPWATLGSKLSGRLSRPGNSTYPLDRQLYDPLFDSVRPAAIAFCATEDDVARSVAFARRHEIALAMRSGRHSYAGYSTTTGLVIDVSLLSKVLVPSAAVATVGAGAQLIDVYSALARKGVSIPAGSCPTVGIAGLTLGGGIGVMDRLWGLTSDNLVSLRLVTAAGEAVSASGSTNADLFWACRGGGGGNFGVVTEFSFRTFPTRELCLYVLTWPWSAASTVLPAWTGWAPAAPDEMWSTCQLETAPGSPSPTVRVAGVWAGSLAGASAELSRFVASAGAPVSRFLGTNSFEEAMYVEAGCRGLSQAACHIRGWSQAGRLARAIEVAKSDIFNEPLSAAGVRAVLDGIDERQRENAVGAVLFDSWGGAIGRVASSATAFVHRRAIASAQYIAMLPPTASAAAARSARVWLEAWYASLRPYASGEAYQNYIDPYLKDWARAYYGTNLGRLEAVKAKWDPDDVWRFAQSVPSRAHWHRRAGSAAPAGVVNLRS
jgi:FAD/FMN-containing dehydrogenase